MWKNGRNAKMLSPWPSVPPFQVRFSPTPALYINILETMFSWLSITPLGRPVVPDEYARNARSSFGFTLVLRYFSTAEKFLMELKCLNLIVGSFLSPSRMILSSRIPTFLAASRETWREASCVTKAFAPASFRWKASSSAVQAGFAGETIPPAQWHPHVNAGVSILFGVKNASTSPFFQSQSALSPAPNSDAVRFTSV